MGAQYLEIIFTEVKKMASQLLLSGKMLPIRYAGGRHLLQLASYVLQMLFVGGGKQEGLGMNFQLVVMSLEISEHIITQEYLP